MHIRDKAYGIETEYGCLVKEGGGWISPAFSHRKNRLEDYIHAYPLKNVGVVVPSDKLWYPNGSKTYIDVGNHPEHSTAEARTIRDAVIHYKAGERVIARTFASDRVQLYKNNVSQAPGEVMATFACHENYSSRFFDRMRCPQYAALVPFLATRQILDGAGCWDAGENFFLSQRAFFKSRLLGMELSFPFSVKGQDPMCRAHIVTGDSNILEFASFLKLGTTSLVLSLIEQGCFPELTCFDGMKALCDVTRRGPMDPIVNMRSHGFMSAHAIQVRYWEAANILVNSATFDSDDTAAECVEIIRKWEHALNAIWSNDTAWMLGRIDWATKKWLGENRIAVGADREGAKRKKQDFDILYHLISDLSLQDRMNAQWPDRRIVTDEEIERATLTPPAGTRAAARGKFVQAMHAHAKQVHHIIWNGIYLDLSRLSVEMPDPFGSYDREVGQLIEAGCG